MQLPNGKLTNALAIANVLIFGLIWLTGSENAGVVAGGFFPARIGDAALFSPEIWALPAWLTPLSAAFLHLGLLHLSFNMLMLVFLGRSIEGALGSGMMAVLYIAGAYAGALAEYLVEPGSTVPIIGASGAISALLGSYALLFAQSEVKPIGPFSSRTVRVAWLAVAWIGIQMLVGFASRGSLIGIAIFAHIGGFVAGLLLVRPLLLWRFRGA